MQQQAASQTPLFRGDGNHWQEHGETVYHRDIKGQPKAGTGICVASYRSPSISMAPVVMMRLDQEPLHLSLALTPDDALSLASALCDAATMAREVQAILSAGSAAAQEGTTA